MYVTSPGNDILNCNASSPNVLRLWAFDKNKNSTALTVPDKELIFIDSTGKPFTKNGVSFKILRSGRRNNLGLLVSSATGMKNPIQKNKLDIITTNDIISASAVEYKEKWQVDKDVIVKKTYYTPLCTTVESDSIDCSGTLEKYINPYLKGLIGNFKPYRSYTYYGSRNDSDVNITTAIRKNGYLNNFTNYWAFNTVNNLVPDYSNVKWVWNSELTKVNSKGRELETMDALNRYTAALYGFNKNMPVAVVQNAQSGEAASEGFEDVDYKEALSNKEQNNCARHDIEFEGSGSIVNTGSSSTLKAHTGEYMLMVSGNTKAEKTFNAGPFNSAGYPLHFGKDTTRVLNTPGGNFSVVSNGGVWEYDKPATASFGISEFTLNVYPAATAFHYYTAICSTYIQITTSGTYHFKIKLSTAENNYATPGKYANAFGVSIYDVNNQLINNTMVSKTSSENSNTIDYSVILCPGIYKIEGGGTELFEQLSNPRAFENSYSWQCTNCQSPDYQNLSTENGCISTKAIAATNDMFNPSFKLTPGKRMQFSAWVKENCDSTICNKPSYINNHVALQFPESVSEQINIYPAGPIIDGWQRLAAEFTVPSNVTTAKLILSNDGSQNVYFDDIRIHPFNANMKSYVYDPLSLKLSAELDENNYASFYEYDEEGQLVRVKKETIQGIKTIKETRSAKQKLITDLQ